MSWSLICGFCQAGGVSANERAGDSAGRPMGEGPERGWRSIGETCFTLQLAVPPGCPGLPVPAPNAQSQNAHSHLFLPTLGYTAKVNIVTQTVEEGISFIQLLDQNGEASFVYCTSTQATKDQCRLSPACKGNYVDKTSATCHGDAFLEYDSVHNSKP